MPVKEETVVEGEVVEAPPNTMFKVKLDTGHKALAHISGKMRVHYIRILPGRSRQRGALALRSQPRPITYRFR